MSDTDYQSRTLSELVCELHEFGDNSIQIKLNSLTAIHEKDDSNLRRFRSKSQNRKKHYIN